MKKLTKLLKLFIYNSKLTMARNMEYRFDFILGFFMNLIFSSVGPIIQYLIFTQTKGFPGWNLKQIILFQGVLLLLLGIKNTLWAGLPDYVTRMVRRGELDRLLLKPFSSIGIILASGFTPSEFGAIIGGIVLMGYSVGTLQLPLSPLRVIMFLIFLLFGLMLFMAMNIIYSCVVIMLVNIGRLNEIMECFSRFGQYPLEIYSKILGTVFMTVIPFAIWVYIPSKILIEGLNVGMLYSLVFCLLFTALSLRLWDRCIRHYTSGGG